MNIFDNVDREIQQLEAQMEELKNRREEIKREERREKRRELEKMTTAEKWEAIKQLPPLTDELMDLLINQGFVTGSSVYSDITPEDHDWCIIIPPATFEGYALGTDADYWVEDGMTPLYAHYQGTRINIICMSDAEMWDAWYMTTEIMKQLRLMKIAKYTHNRNCDIHGLLGMPAPEFIQPLEHSFDLKWNRVAVFRALKEVLWPVRTKTDPLSMEEAITHRNCRKCHRKAELFTNAMMRKQWETTGICERCEPKLLPGIEGAEPESHLRRRV